MDAAADIDTELLRCVAEGDVRRAGALLVARYADDVYAMCRAMVRDDATAEDLSQDAFGRAFVALAQFRGDASPRTWLLRIAKNRCIDHLRKQRREPRGFDEEPDLHPTDEPLAIDALLSRADVARALATLNEGERALVVLRFGHGVAYPDLAAAFGLREGTVRMRLSRAVSKMRAALEPEGGAAAMPRARRAPDDAPADSASLFEAAREESRTRDERATQEGSAGAPPPPPHPAAPAHRGLARSTGIHGAADAPPAPRAPANATPRAAPAPPPQSGSASDPSAPARRRAASPAAADPTASASRPAASRAGAPSASLAPSPAAMSAHASRAAALHWIAPDALRARLERIASAIE